MRHDKATMNKQRRALAIIGFLLPILCIVPGLPFISINGPTFWYSISATYYATSGDIMRLALGIFGGWLITYLGYDIGDRLTCILSGVFSFCIVAFPCKCDAAGVTTGIFNLPTDLSHIAHCIFAALLFGSFAYMVGWRFTKTDAKTKQEMTYGKLVRNDIYRACALIIIAAMILQAGSSILKLAWFTIINETIMLWAFSFAWAIKAGMFTKFVDKLKEERYGE